MFQRLRRSLNHEPREVLKEDSLTPEVITALSPLDFEPIMSDLPSELPVGDERLNELVKMLHKAAIEPIDSPLPVSSLPTLDRSARSVRVTLPEDLQEGAEMSEYAIPLPVRAFVSAPGVVDWNTGRQDNKNGRASQRIIDDYSRRMARTSPPIQHVKVFIRPDGAVYAALTGDGAHRLCAAKRRGDTDIMCREVTINQLAI